MNIQIKCYLPVKCMILYFIIQTSKPTVLPFR